MYDIHVVSDDFKGMMLVKQHKQVRGPDLQWAPRPASR